MEPIRLVIIDPPFPPRSERRPGMMWRFPADDVLGPGDKIRESWWIMLPDDDPRVATPGHPGEISWRTTDRAATKDRGMWIVEGTPPDITVKPSIDVECWVRGADGQPPVRQGSYWHGHIVGGYLVD